MLYYAQVASIVVPKLNLHVSGEADHPTVTPMGTSSLLVK